MRAGQTPKIPHLLATLALIAGLVMFATSSANATGPLWGSTYPSKITNKLGNGIGNIFFCWSEVPYELNHEIQNTDPVTGTVTGLGRGIFYTGQRLVLGVVDVFTFPFDLYDNNYQSVQRTKFPFIDEAE